MDLVFILIYLGISLVSNSSFLVNFSDFAKFIDLQKLFILICEK